LKTHEINVETRPSPIGLTDHTETQRFRYQTHHLSSIKAKAKKKQQPTLIPPNQVSYLKESSIESFTLWPTLKIDFRLSAATSHTTTVSERSTQLNRLTI
jgi:hypothetical protein